MVPTDRRTAKKAAKSASEMRGRLPIRWTGRAPDLIQRRTVRGSTLRQVAMSLIVRKRGRRSLLFRLSLVMPLPKAEAATAP
jgi:hypothetical protein